MNNYKLEQEKQDKEFEKKFGGDFDDFSDNPRSFYSGLRGDTSYERSLFSNVKSYLLTRDQALLEAFKQDVVEMIVGLKKEFWDDQDHAVGGYISRKEINDFLKDYNLNK